MTKRKKKRSQPNLPQETLERARREAGIENDEETEDSEASLDVDVEPVAASPLPLPQSRPEMPSSQRRKRRREIVVEELTHEEIADLLAHPTKEVTLEALKAQYSYVVADLRSMWLLAAALFIVMIAAARFL
jgi:hypothetical protein